MTIYDDALATLKDWEPTSPGAAEAAQRTLELLTAGPVAMTREHRPGHVTASALIVDPDGRFLLCLHGRLNMWMQVGGHCELDDESLAAAALREATEESGISGLAIDPVPIDVDVHPVTCKGYDAIGETKHYDVRFLVRSLPGVVEQVSEESHALAWFTEETLPGRLAPGVRQQFAPARRRIA